MASTPILTEAEAKEACERWWSSALYDPDQILFRERVDAGSRAKFVKQVKRILGPDGGGHEESVASRTYEEVWPVLNKLVEGLVVRLENLSPVVTLEDGVLRESPVDDGLPTWGWLLPAFYDLLRVKPFPFARCPTCHTIFVRVRRQRYCSHQCASRGLEAARKGTRREYMRRYMAMRRAKARKTAQRKGR